MDKIKTCIENVVLNTPIFNKESFSPTLLNFFYGKNGSGKSTIAKEIKTPGVVKWNDPFSITSDSIYVYNEDYIKENIQSYGNIPGVFTITEQNAKVKAEVDNKQREKRSAEATLIKLTDAVINAEKRVNAVEDKYINTVWKTTEEIRKKYPETQSGFMSNKKKFANRIEQTQSIQYDFEEIEKLYKFAYGNDAKRYQPFKTVSLSNLPDDTILSESIVGSASSTFASFLKDIGAADWVRQGHIAYQHKAGEKCPYCQGILPNDFEEKLAECFDDSYKRRVNELNRFYQTYRSSLASTRDTLQQNNRDNFDCPELKEYSFLVQQFISTIDKNLALLQTKLDEPGKTIELDDFHGIVAEINSVIGIINDHISANNTAYDDRDGSQRKCEDMVWCLMRYNCEKAMAVHDSEAKAANLELKKANDGVKTKKGEIFVLDQIITELNQKTVNTDAAKNSINDLLKASGFQGFYLREKPGAQYVYELVRDDKTIAKNLSEGERNFIAFLYFYQTIIGSQSDDGIKKNKIVVIDDPVSSMDSGSLFVVASLVRNLIAICYNNYQLSNEQFRDDYIKQFFCMTHNPYFFKEITYNHLKDNECAAFYEIKKGAGNKSKVIPCEEPGTGVGATKVNRSPVRNHYDALWNDYCTTQDPLMLMNDVRQILEYYFIQLCGYKGANLRENILDRNKDAFMKKNATGKLDDTNYIIASSMFSLLNAGANGFNDGLFYDENAFTVEQIQFVFYKIFEVMEQTQHYKMMTGEK